MPTLIEMFLEAVSILVLMEVALKAISNFSISSLGTVSILVLMEVALKVI